MKVIDLLNKIANGEDVPKRIKYKVKMKVMYFSYCDQCKTYELEESPDKDLYYYIDNLNDDIEIIETKEDNTINIDSIEEANINTKFTDYPTEITYLKIKYNELIRAAKQLNREIKELKENKDE